ncbi:MAG TPA: molecular chaperone TorD family protein [Streptosporangiaceae bacterium]|nr:molecular chaperone TorD family protein [Streptosporangiaceae bacterium]
MADSPADARTASELLGLPGPDPAEHTEVFVLNCPPYAAIYLGPDGNLGGEAADRAAGFWRALGLTPPAEPDHLAALLGLYAGLGEAAAGTHRTATRAALTRARTALLAEHLWPWLPGYLDAITDLATAALPAWAGLIGQAITAEVTAGGLGQPPGARRLPLALRSAPPPPHPGSSLSDLLTALVAPARSGMILTRARLAQGAAHACLGHRIGERRFTLRAMLEQDAPATLAWLSQEAERWSSRHAGRAAGDITNDWWSRRAARTADLLREAAAALPTAAAAGQDRERSSPVPTARGAR